MIGRCIKFVQFQKNSSHHSGINCTPYSDMFGCEARIGITSSSLPAEVIATLQSEDDLFATVNGDNVAAQNLAPSTVSADATTDLEPEPVTCTCTAVTSPTDPGREDDSRQPTRLFLLSLPALLPTTYSKHWQSEQLRSENVERKPILTGRKSSEAYPSRPESWCCW